MMLIQLTIHVSPCRLYGQTTRQAGMRGVRENSTSSLSCRQIFRGGTSPTYLSLAAPTRNSSPALLLMVLRKWCVVLQSRFYSTSEGLSGKFRDEKKTTRRACEDADREGISPPRNGCYVSVHCPSPIQLMREYEQSNGRSSAAKDDTEPFSVPCHGSSEVKIINFTGQRIPVPDRCRSLPGI